MVLVGGISAQEAEASGGHVWVSSASGTALVRLSGDGSPAVTVDLPGPVFGVAVDASGAAWAARTDAPLLHRVALDGASSQFEVGAVVRSLAISSDGSVWAVRQALSDVIRMDEFGTILGIFAVGPVPYGIAVDGSQMVWVTNTYGASVSRIDPLTGSVAVFPVDLFPTGLAAHPDGSLWVVSKESVQRLDSTGAVTFSTMAGWHSRGVAVDADGQVWVSNELSNDVYRFAANGALLGIVPVGQRPWGIAGHGNGGIYVLCSLGDGIWKVDPTGTVESVVAFEGAHAFGDLTGLARAMVVDPSGDADADGHTNSFELDLDYDPLDSESVPVAFVRGDSDSNGIVELADGVRILSYLFDDVSLTCAEAADVNDDGGLNLLDAVRVFAYVFGGQAAPAPPFPGAGFDPTPRSGFPCGEW